MMKVLKIVLISLFSFLMATLLVVVVFFSYVIVEMASETDPGRYLEPPWLLLIVAIIYYCFDFYENHIEKVPLIFMAGFSISFFFMYMRHIRSKNIRNFPQEIANDITEEGIKLFVEKCEINQVE